jgi:hypothetical protein
MDEMSLLDTSHALCRRYTGYSLSARYESDSERVTVLSPDIGTGFQICFCGYCSRRFWPTYIVARPDPQRDKSHSGLEKATRGMHFSAMELNALIHKLKQQIMLQIWPIKRMYQNEDERPFPVFKFGNELDDKQMR